MTNYSRAIQLAASLYMYNVLLIHLKIEIKHFFGGGVRDGERKTGKIGEKFVPEGRGLDLDPRQHSKYVALTARPSQSTPWINSEH